jgi:hypothetical protein
MSKPRLFSTPAREWPQSHCTKKIIYRKNFIGHPPPHKKGMASFFNEAMPVVFLTLRTL